MINDDSRREEVEQCLERCSTFGDDSSDEEDDNNGIKNPLRNFKQFYDNRIALCHNNELCRQKIHSTEYPNPFQFGQYHLSFITHAVAVKLLYSPTIQSAYYAQKRKIRNQFQANFNYEQLITGIERAAEHVVYFQGKFKHANVQRDISQKIFNNVKGFINALINEETEEFFHDLIHLNGYWSDNLLGWYFKDELGQLRVNWIDRPSETLSTDLSQSQQFPVDFFANLRLHSRLEKRRMKSKNDLSAQTSTWTYSDSPPVQIIHEIKRYGSLLYKGEEVLFNTRRLTYNEICENIRQKNFEANELLTVFTNGPNQISEFGACLHYLLFGLEVMRNPSALIHNMMMLELIQNNRLSWEDFLIDKQMPMSMVGAERAARFKNYFFDPFMPHKYTFDRTYPEYSKNFTSAQHAEAATWASKLLQKESNLTKKWLKMSYGEEVFAFITNEGDINTEYLDPIFYDLQTKCFDWFDIDIQGQHA